MESPNGRRMKLLKLFLTPYHARWIGHLADCLCEQTCGASLTNQAIEILDWGSSTASRPRECLNEKLNLLMDLIKWRIHLYNFFVKCLCLTRILFSFDVWKGLKPLTWLFMQIKKPRSLQAKKLSRDCCHKINCFKITMFNVY